MELYTIYKITCIPNGKIYIGQTKDIKSRMSSHFGGGKQVCKNPMFIADYKQYGRSQFKVEQLVEYELTKDEANELEEVLIRKLDATNPDIGYNRSKGSFSQHYDHAKRVMVNGIEYQSAYMANKALGLHKGCLYSILNGKRVIPGINATYIN